MLNKSIFFFLAVVLVACNNQKVTSENASNLSTNISETNNLLTVNDFNLAITNTKDALIIDVRTPNEFKSGHLKNALNLDWKGPEFNKQLETLDKNQTLYVYCLSGGRSAEAIKAMRAKGFNNINELDGGILAWRTAGFDEVGTNTKNGMSMSDYTKMLNSDKLILVDFYADWCAPCKKMKPFLESISKKFEDKVQVVRINVDENSELAKELKVNGLPVLKLYSKNELKWENLGYIDEQGIIDQIGKY